MADTTLSVNVVGRDGLSSELKRIESGVIRFVGAVSSALAAISVIAFPVLESARFQKELLNTGKTTEYTKEQLMVLKGGLVELSTQINVTATDLAKIATMGGQLGIGGGGNTGGLLSFVQEIATAVTALDVSAEEAVTAIGKLINIFNVPATKYRNLVSALNAVSNASNATASELFDVTRRIGNLGGAVDIPQATALAASMIDLGLTAETAGTTVTKIFANMKSKASEFAAFVGGTMTTEKWVDILQGQGLKALDLYLDRLNAIGPAAAAAAKIDLTGGGRIFEAVTKLQQQRGRAAALESRVAREQINLEKIKGTLSKEQLATATENIARLQDQAVKINVVTRLLRASQEGYDMGDSAVKEQQTVLAGLSAQWAVFLNNVRKIAISVGDVALLPLTDALSSMSRVMRDADVGAQLAEGFREIIETVRSATEYLAFYTAGVKGLSSGVDWGSALQLGALLAAMAVLRGLGLLIAGLGGKLLLAVPGLGALSRALFGVSAAAAAAAAASAASGASTERVGGIYNRVKDAVAGFASKMGQLDGLYAKLAQKEAALATATARYAQQLAAVAAGFGNMNAQTRTRVALEASLAAVIARRDAAILAGNNRSVSRNNTEIARQSAILANVIRLEAAAYSTAAVMGRLNTEINATTQSITKMSTGLVRVVEVFRAAREAGASFVEALALARGALLLALPGGGFLTKVIASLVTATSALTTFAQQAKAAFLSGAQGSTGLVAVLRGIKNAALVAGQALRTALGNVATGGLAKLQAQLVVLRGYLLQTAMNALGLGAAWATATSQITRGALLAVAAVMSLAAAVRLLRNVMYSLLSIAFFGMIIKEALQFLGVWDRVTDAFERIAAYFNIDKARLPEWMRSTKTTERMVQITDEQRKATEANTAAAARYNETMATTIALLADQQSARERLTYNAADPDTSTEELRAGTEALILLESKRLSLLKDHAAQLTQQRELQKQLMIDGARMLDARGGAYEVSAERNYEDTRASLQGMNLAISTTRTLLKEINTDGPKVATNLATSMLTGAEAIRVLSRNTLSGKTLLEDFADAQARIVEANQKLAAQREADPQGIRAPGSSNDGAARAARLRAELSATSAVLKKAEEDAAAFEARIRQATPGNLAIENFLKAFKTAAADAPALREVGRRMSESIQDGMGTFKGNAMPKVTSADLLEAGATKVVASQLQGMYSSLAAGARASAELAKNAYAQALTEVGRALKQSVQAVFDLGKAWDAAAQKAKDYKPDQASDKNLRERMSVLDMEQRKEEDMARWRYAEGSDMLRRELLYIEEKFRKEREMESQVVEFKKAKRSADREIAEYNRLAAGVKQYITELQKVNEIIENPEASRDSRLEALEKLKTLTAEGKVAYEKMNTEAVRLAGIAPIGEKLVISEEQKNKFIADVGALGKELAKVSTQTAPSLEGVYTRLAGDLDAEAQKYKEVVAAMDKSLVTYAENSKKTMAAVVTDLTTAMSQSEEYMKVLRRVGETAGQIKASPSFMTTDEVQAQTKKYVADMVAALEQSKPPAVVVPLTLDQKNVIAQLEGPFKELVATHPATVTAKIEPKPGAVNDFAKSVSDQMPSITVDVLANVTGTKGKSTGGATGRYARGGFVERLQSFANGGRVRGAGTGTSDSILSWLSNGEYVMDAMTTSKFGSKFFASLQAAARGGKASSVMRNMSKVGMPRFASGGPVATRPFSGTPSGIAAAQEGLQAVRDSVEVTLNLGGKKVSLFGQRQQASELVKAFKNMEAGA